jgi:hypothetical protein
MRIYALGNYFYWQGSFFFVVSKILDEKINTSSPKLSIHGLPQAIATLLEFSAPSRLSSSEPPQINFKNLQITEIIKLTN